MSDLKNCPFCGAPASQDTEGFTFCSENCVYVDCGKSAWNRRAASPAVVDLVRAVRFYCDSFEPTSCSEELRCVMGALRAVEKELHP